MKKLILASMIALTAFAFAKDNSSKNKGKDNDDLKGKLEEIIPSVSEGAGKAAAKIKEETKSGIKKIGSKFEENTLLEATGVLKVHGKGKNKTYSIKDIDGTTYILHTVTGSEKSYATLDLYVGKKIKVNGTCNKETKILTMLGYSLVMEESSKDSTEL